MGGMKKFLTGKQLRSRRQIPNEYSNQGESKFDGLRFDDVDIGNIQKLQQWYNN
jgi:hypothetical protein